MKIRQLSGSLKWTGIRAFIHPSNVDIDNAMLTYPNFVIKPGNFRSIYLTKVNIVSLSSKQNPCFAEETLIGYACISNMVVVIFVVIFGPLYFF